MIDFYGSTPSRALGLNLSAFAQVHTLEVFQKELNESERLVFQAVHGLKRALQGDYRDVVNVKESSRQRLEALREAAIKVSRCSAPCLFDVWEAAFVKSFALEVSYPENKCIF